MNAIRTPARAKKAICRHCVKRIAFRPRGLCRPCHDDKGIRCRYPLYSFELVIAALRKAAGGHYDAAFPWVDLVLIAWKADPQRMGMRGYETQFPDTKRVCALVSYAEACGVLKRVGKANGQGVWKINEGE